MEKNLNLDESLIDQKIDNFINTHLINMYELKFTDIIYNYDKFNFYIKFIDLLRPKLILVNNEYWFNKHTVLRMSVNNLIHFLNQDEKIFHDYLIHQLSLNKQYLDYINRLK